MALNYITLVLDLADGTRTPLATGQALLNPSALTNATEISRILYDCPSLLPCRPCQWVFSLLPALKAAIPENALLL
jgi:hypothetical protein